MGKGFFFAKEGAAQKQAPLYFISGAGSTPYLPKKTSNCGILCVIWGPDPVICAIQHDSAI